MHGTSKYSGRITVVTAPVGKKVMFYYGAENGDSEMEHNYGAQSPALHLATTIPVGAARVDSVFVTPFGTISLDRRSYSWSPQAFPGSYTSCELLVFAFEIALWNVFRNIMFYRIIEHYTRVYIFSRLRLIGSLVN